MVSDAIGQGLKCTLEMGISFSFPNFLLEIGPRPNLMDNCLLEEESLQTLFQQLRDWIL